MAGALKATGLNDIGDQNGVFGDGYFPTAYSNAANQRVTTATAYLTDESERRPNLTILVRGLTSTQILLRSSTARHWN